MTNINLKNQIDSDITNKTSNKSVTTANVGNNMKAVVDYADSVASTPGPQGVAGATGAQGPQGVAGPVGPAGLLWKGSWVSGTSYLLNDSVGYNGASWYCILATSGTTAPNLDTTHWALLAAQGSPGPQGPQGATGLQGPTGATGPAGTAVSTTGTVTALDFGAGQYAFLQYTQNTVNTSAANLDVVLPAGASIGTEIIVLAGNNAYSFKVHANTGNSPLLSLTGVSTTVTSITVNPNYNYRFTQLNAGLWKVEALGANLQQVINAGTTVVSGATTLNLSGANVRVSNSTHNNLLDVIGLNLANTSTGDNTYITPNLVVLSNGAGSSTYLNSTASGGDRNISLPNQSGTIALTSDIPATTPSLQQVINSGSSTTNGTRTMSLANANALFTTAAKSNTVDETGINITWTGIGATNIAANSATFTNASNFSTVLQNSAATANRTINFPNNSGTLALATGTQYQRINSDGSNSVGYKRVRVLLNQTSINNPTVDIIENTSGLSFSMVRNGSAGNYTLTASAALFQQGFTFITYLNNDVSVNHRTIVQRTSTTSIDIKTYNNGVAADGILIDASLEILIKQ